MNFFLFLWVIVALLDPDQDCESGSRNPTVSGVSDSDPDPQNMSVVKKGNSKKETRQNEKIADEFNLLFYF